MSLQSSANADCDDKQVRERERSMCQYACVCVRVCVCESVCTTECEREANPDHDTRSPCSSQHMSRLGLGDMAENCITISVFHIGRYR